MASAQLRHRRPGLTREREGPAPASGETESCNSQDIKAVGTATCIPPSGSTSMERKEVGIAARNCATATVRSSMKSGTKSVLRIRFP